jgi:hypothetical protein
MRDVPSFGGIMAEKMKYECHFGGQDFLIRQFISQPCPITKKDCFFEIKFCPVFENAAQGQKQFDPY